MKTLWLPCLVSLVFAISAGAGEGTSFRHIAHRGASMRAPENTLAAFRAARDIGAREIETDVQLTTDGVLVLCHDTTLARYKLGDFRVEQLPYAPRRAGAGTPAGTGDAADAPAPALSELDFGAWFSPKFAGERIATLGKLLDAHAGDFDVFHIELKGAHPRLAAETIAILKARGLRERCVLTSFSLKQLRRAREADAEIRLAYLLKTAVDEKALDAARELGLFQLCPKAAAVTPEGVAAALKVVPEVRAWGCPREAEAARRASRAVADAGCVGITTDEPGWFENTALQTGTPPRPRAGE